MPDKIPLAQQLSIREAGLDEYWLQDQIYDNPSCLGLGELEALSKEKKQSWGGRLDILLKDPADDAMYEVEVMLGETDETHIIRTIEYWDNEKRRWPNRQHSAVLVAELINRRFFNVIHLLSYSIPFIAIQASLLEINGVRSLYFSKILDTYEEPDDNGGGGEDTPNDREFWLAKASNTVATADTLLAAVKEVLPTATLTYLKYYIGINVGGNNYLWLRRRGGDGSIIGFKMSPFLQEEVEKLLNDNKISYTRKPKEFVLPADKELIQSHLPAIRSLAEFVKRSWTNNA